MKKTLLLLSKPWKLFTAFILIILFSFFIALIVGKINQNRIANDTKNSKPLWITFVSSADNEWENCLISLGKKNYSIKEASEKNLIESVIYTLDPSNNSLISVGLIDDNTSLTAVQKNAKYWIRTTDPKIAIQTPAIEKPAEDTTAPTASKPQIDEVGTTLTTLKATWTPSVDNESGIKEYLVSMGTCATCEDIFKDVTTGRHTNIEHSGLSLSLDKTYYINIKARNYSDLTSEAGVSSGFNIKPTVNEYSKEVTDESGKKINLDTTPVKPPEILPPAQTLPTFIDINGRTQSSNQLPTEVLNQLSGIKILSSVPAYDWTYGCGPTSGGMVVGYFDNNNFPNLYTGPANNGVAPLTNSWWGSREVPFIASHKNIDSRNTRGHVDDYWNGYYVCARDPFDVGGWSAHPNDSVADFMGANQYAYQDCSINGSSDGGTIFTFDYSGYPMSTRGGGDYIDGAYGIAAYIESKGYEVPEYNYYNQYIAGLYTARGFSFENFKSEINAGRPVMIQLIGHVVAGFGYDETGGQQKIYIHDTWGPYDTSMQWGGTYYGMRQTGVTVIKPINNGTPPPDLDTELPNVNIVSPSASSTVKDTVTFSANITDNKSVDRVEFYFDNNYLATVTTTTPPLYKQDINTKNLTNGNHIFKVLAYDPSNNLGQATVSFTVNNTITPPPPVDTEAPKITITSPQQNSTVKGSVTFSSIVTDNVKVRTVEYYIDSNYVVLLTNAPFSMNIDTTAYPDGTHTFRIVANDGLQSSVASLSFNILNFAPPPIDTEVPVVTITSPGEGITVKGNITLSANVTDNVKVQKVEFYFDNVYKAKYDIAPFTKSMDTNFVSDGEHKFRVEATDGTNLTKVEIKFIVKNNNTPVPDLTPPIVAITAPNNNAKVSGTSLFSANVTDNVKVEKVEFYINTTLVGTMNQSPFNQSVNTTQYSNGTYQFKVIGYDLNQSATATVNFIVENIVIPPIDTVAPTVNITSPAANSTVSNVISLSSNVTDNVTVTKVEFYLDDLALTVFSQSPYKQDYDTKSLSNGPHAFKVVGYDSRQSSTQSVNFTVNNTVTPPIDNVAPVVAITSPIANNKVSQTIVLSVTVTDNVKVEKVEFYLDNILLPAVKATDNNPNLYKQNLDTTTLTNTSHTFKVIAYDTRQSATQTVDFTVENAVIPPPITDTQINILKPLDKSTVANTITLSASIVSKKEIKKVEFYIDSIFIAKFTTPDSIYKFSVNSISRRYKDGEHKFTVEATDQDNKLASKTSTFNLLNNSSQFQSVLDLPKPAVIITAPSTSPFAWTGGDITISAIAKDDSGITKTEMYLDGQLITTTNFGWINSPLVYANVSMGEHILRVQAYSKNGNIGFASVKIVKN